MNVAAHDQAYLAAAPDRVYARLADPATYGEWWPQMRGRARMRNGEEHIEVAFTRGGRFVGVETSRRRPGVGLVLGLDRPLHGTLEWYLEPFRNGTIVNAIVDLAVRGGSRRSARGLLRFRRVIRRGLVGLAKALE